MRSSIVGIALNPFYILNSFVGVIGCLTLNSVFITCYMGGNTILNFALIVVGVVQVLMPHGDMMGLYFYGPGCLLDQIIVCQSWPLLRCIARADRASRGAPDAPPPPDAREPPATPTSALELFAQSDARRADEGGCCPEPVPGCADANANIALADELCCAEDGFAVCGDAMDVEQEQVILHF